LTSFAITLVWFLSNSSKQYGILFSSSVVGINAVDGNRQFLAAVTRTNSKPFKSSRGVVSFGSLDFKAFVEAVVDFVDDAEPGRAFEAGDGAGLDSFVFWGNLVMRMRGIPLSLGCLRLLTSSLAS
jgi:hypothetical protein